MNPVIQRLFSFSGLTRRSVVPKYLFSGPLAQLVEQLTFNQWVTGSNPVRLTTKINDLAEITQIFGFFKRDDQRDKRV